MYTIGQIANILGISRDKLRYYEEKGILAPTQNKENNYRQYNLKDIDIVLAIEFYRSLDLEFRTINKLYKQSDIEEIEYILENKHNDVLKEIDRLNAIINRIEKAKKGCKDIEKYLNKYILRPMEPVKILGEISDFRAYNEFDVIHENKNELDGSPVVKSLKRCITFNDEGIKSNKMFITKDIDSDNTEEKNDILKYEKCIYTIVEDGIDNKDVMEKTFMNSIEWMHTNNYKHKGIAIISMLLIEYHEGRTKSYLEVYIPIE